MWSEPSKTVLSKIPKLYETEEVPMKEKIVYLHFFIGNTDWYAIEYDENKRIFFGFVILGGDTRNAEWGYFPFDELREISISGFQVDCETPFKQKKAIEIEKIREAYNFSD